MKKAEDIVDKIQEFGTSNQNFWYVKPNEVVKAIKQAQIDAIDATTKAIIEDVELAEIDGIAYDIDVNSAKSIADKLKKELE